MELTEKEFPGLTQMPFFQGFNPRLFKLLVEDAFEINYQPGQFVFHQGEPANSFYVVLRGQVAVGVYPERHGPKKIQTIGEGDILGWSWLIPPHQWRFDAMAQESSRLLLLQGKKIREQSEKDLELGYILTKKVAQALATRLEGARLQLLDLYGPEKGRKFP